MPVKNYKSKHLRPTVCSGIIIAILEVNISILTPNNETKCLKRSISFSYSTEIIQDTPLENGYLCPSFLKIHITWVNIRMWTVSYISSATQCFLLQRLISGLLQLASLWTTVVDHRSTSARTECCCTACFEPVAT